MKLLIITQKIDRDDHYFGFFHDWLLLFARECKKLTVISLETGTYDLPANVKVLSLGKEHGRSLIKYIWSFIWYSWKYRHEYTHVFCHMSPLYVILGAPLWKLSRKPIGLWYIHRSADFKLWLAEKLVTVVFTSSKESFRSKSSKVHFMGQAVNIKKFKNPNQKVFGAKSGVLKLVSIGRITPIKNLNTLIEAVDILVKDGVSIEVEFIGAPVLEGDFKYQEKLKEMIKSKKLNEVIKFIGSIPNKDIAGYYWRSDLSVNLCPTGGMDKAILESMAAGIPVLVSNKAFTNYFGKFAKDLIFKQRDPNDLAWKVKLFSERSDKERIASFLREQTSMLSSLDNLIGNIIALLKNETS